MPEEEIFEVKYGKCHQKGLVQSMMKSAENFQYIALYLGQSPKPKFKYFQDLGQNDDNNK